MRSAAAAVVLLGQFLFASMTIAEVNIGGILQGGFDKRKADDARIDFTLNRARLLFEGEVNYRIDFFVQTDMVSGIKTTEDREVIDTYYDTVGDSLVTITRIVEDTSGGPELLDVKFNFMCPLLNTRFTLGRFKPEYTYYMPMHTGKLDLINYPLLTTETGMNYQVGIQTWTMRSLFGLNLGIFNGANDKNNWSDISGDGKDLLIRGEFNMAEGCIKTAGYYWLENAFFAKAGDAEGNKLGFYGVYNSNGIKAIAEYLETEDEGVSGEGFYLQAGYMFLDERVEVLFRYDSWDQDTDHVSNEDTRFTSGLNCYLSGHDAMFYFNYIMEREDDQDDQVVIQYQILF